MRKERRSRRSRPGRYQDRRPRNVGIMQRGAARSGSDGGKLDRVRVDGWVDASCRVFVLNFGLCCGGPWEKSAKASSSSS
jgi:hypothetical protein